MDAWTIAAVLETGFNATPDLAVGLPRSVSANLGTSFNASANLTGRTVLVSANLQTAFAASPALTGRNSKLSAQLQTGFTASQNLTGASDSHGMNICDLVGEQLAMWGIFCYRQAPAYMLARAINDLNSAMQEIWNGPAADRSYWSGETLTVKFLTAGASSESTIYAGASVGDVADLPDSVQNVTGPCRLATTKRPLASIGTSGDIEQFADLYLDGRTADEPVAFHVSRLTQAGIDPARCQLIISPAATVATDILLDVVKEPARYVVGDLQSCPIVPIPHKYAESILRPVVMYLGSTFHLFRKPELKPAIDAAYAKARVLLGYADPLPGNSGDNQPKTPDKP